MASGYENSPDYGGPEPKWPTMIIGAIGFMLIVGGVWSFPWFGGIGQ